VWVTAAGYGSGTVQPTLHRSLPKQAHKSQHAFASFAFGSAPVPAAPHKHARVWCSLHRLRDRSQRLDSPIITQCSIFVPTQMDCDSSPPARAYSFAR
jgi:hypothetical protein